MYSDTEVKEEEEEVRVLFVQEEVSSEEPPMEEWPSLIVYEEYKPRKVLSRTPSGSEVCDAYVALSDSSVFRHVYYKYPAVIDPGIEDALLKPEESPKYGDDGQELYLALCEEHRQCPVAKFHKELLTKEINLSYYGVNPRGVLAMSKALAKNEFVEKINLTDNFLTDDACFHLGEMLKTNKTLEEFILAGCRIGPSGLKMFLEKMRGNITLTKLNLSRNNLTDEGIEHLAYYIFRGLKVKEIILSHNNITGTGLSHLTEAFETHNNFTHMDLSWNSIFQPGLFRFITAISETSEKLVEIDLSWNSLQRPIDALAITKLFRMPSVRRIYLNNNQFMGEAISNIAKNLYLARRLQLLDISNNPLSFKDVAGVLQTMSKPYVRLPRLYMDNICVDATCLELLRLIKTTRPKITITHGELVGIYKIKGPEFRNLVLNRADFFCRKRKKNKTDFGMVILKMQKEAGFPQFMIVKDIVYKFRVEYGIVLEEDLVNSLFTTWPGPKDAKNGDSLNLANLVEFIKRKWPDKKLPPTPPPEPEPEPPPPPKRKGKGKK